MSEILLSIHPLTHRDQLPHLQNLKPVPSLAQAIPACIIIGATAGYQDLNNNY